MRKIVTRLKHATHIGSSLSLRLVYLTGKHSSPIHPKHLTRHSLWFRHVLRKDARVLDVGCGNGQVALKTAAFTHSVVGVEKDSEHIRMAIEDARTLGVGIVTFLRADLEEPLAFRSSAFDIVLLLDVLEHIKNDLRLLHEIQRVLKNRGVLCVAVPNRDTRWKEEQRDAGMSGFSDKDHKREYTNDEIRECLRQSGFRIQSMEPVTYDTWLAGLIDLLGGISLAAYRRCSRWKAEMVKRYPRETTGWRVIARKI